MVAAAAFSMRGRRLHALLLCTLCTGSTGVSSALRASPTRSACCRPSVIRLQIGGPPRIVLIWNSPEPFVYENAYGGADLAPLGRSTARFSTLAQALALGRKLQAASGRITYSVYRLGDGEMELKGSYPKQVNAVGAKVKFRRRKPKTGGAEDRQLGVGGMGDDVWRELLEKESWGSIDEAWAKLRRELELGREIEVVDEQGNAVDLGGDYGDEDQEPEYD